jgi:predicted Zn-dependent protease
MKRIATAIKLFALTSLFACTTSASVAYDVQFGGKLFKRQHAPFAATPSNLQEYQALSVSGAANAARSSAATYMSDVTREGHYTWDAASMPLKVYIHDGQNVPGYRQQFSNYVRTSFDWWTQSSGGKLSWIEVSEPTKADVTINWTDKIFERPEGTEAGKTSCLTRLNTATRKGVIYGARMQLLTKLPGREFGDSEVAKTALHEVGHVFGLQGHSRFRDDIMYYAVSPNQEFTLSTRDKATMNQLYANYPVTNGLAVGPKPAPVNP